MDCYLCDPPFCTTFDGVGIGPLLVLTACLSLGQVSQTLFKNTQVVYCATHLHIYNDRITELLIKPVTVMVPDVSPKRRAG